jgi:hypothetical protein
MSPSRVWRPPACRARSRCRVRRRRAGRRGMPARDVETASSFHDRVRDPWRTRTIRSPRETSRDGRTAALPEFVCAVRCSRCLPSGDRKSISTVPCSNPRKFNPSLSQFALQSGARRTAIPLAWLVSTNRPCASVVETSSEWLVVVTVAPGKGTTVPCRYTVPARLKACESDAPRRRGRLWNVRIAWP